MFNETSYLSGDTFAGETAECRAIRERCVQEWPDDGFPVGISPANKGLTKCLIDAGYQTPSGGRGGKCLSVTHYDLPGATTYPLDVITNPDNPNFLWQFPDLNNLNLQSLGIGAGAGIMIAGAVLLILFLRR